jgi:2-oxoacid:acceptor oxidoreductase delta subunit (pyruvate/2-ketoisovalerate family)
MELPFAITLGVGSSRANKTGSWRVERPVYVDRLPPCSAACPAGEDIQAWLYRAEEADYHAAWRKIVEENPFPAVMGRVCFHPCQTACNRATLDEAVGINAVERFLGDQAIAERWPLPPPGPASGRRVLVVGAGPAGLACAYHLRLAGHSVVVSEAAEEPGGMMRYGIPRFRLPRDVVDSEIRRVLDMGIELRLGERITDLAAAVEVGAFDAAFVAVGAQLAQRAYIPAGDSARMLDALSLLADVEERHPPALGRRVVVYGGGDTAMDAARTARRLGATDAVVVYRRTRERMPAHEVELEQAEVEGVTLRWLSTIVGVDGGRVTVERMVLDDTGFPRPTGEIEELGADAVVLALGERADLSLLDGLPGVVTDEGYVRVGTGQATGNPTVFAGGDIVTGDHTVTTAIGHGKVAARAIDSMLAGRDVEHTEQAASATADRLNSWYFADAPASVQPELEPARRATTFDEVVGGLNPHNALFEARRCLSCGNCFECDNCFGVCPDNAVIKLGPGKRYRIDYDFCKGCGLCAAECPCGAIDMVPEET